MASLIESVEKFITAYAIATAKGKELMDAPTKEEQQARIDALCDELIAFRLPGAVSFGLPGPPVQFSSPEQGKPPFIVLLKQLIKFGIEFENELKSKKVQVLYDHRGFGACLIQLVYTWKPHAKSGLEPWDMTVFYGYRKLPTGEEGWEFAYHDDENAGLLKRVGPQFFEGLGRLN